jgi:transposase
VEQTLDARFVDGLPERLIGDNAYDSDVLDAAWAARGVEVIAPHRSNRKNKTQDGRPLRRTKRRWKVERFFGWLQAFRRVLIRIRFLPMMNGSKLADAGGFPCERPGHCRKEPPSAWRRC